MNLDPKYTNTNKTPSERIREARTDAEAAADVETRFQQFSAGIPAATEQALADVDSRKEERLKAHSRRLTGFVGKVAAGTAAVVAAVTIPNMLGNQAPSSPVDSAWPNHPTSIPVSFTGNGGFENSGYIAWNNASEAQKEEAYTNATGKLISDQP